MSTGDDSIGLGKMADGIQGERRSCESSRGEFPTSTRCARCSQPMLFSCSALSERHYTASKLFPYWLSERPIVGVAHEQSTVLEIARQLGGIRICPYSDETGMDQAAKCLLESITALRAGDKTKFPVRNPAGFEPYDARGIARSYAQIFDRIVNSA